MRRVLLALTLVMLAACSPAAGSPSSAPTGPTAHPTPTPTDGPDPNEQVAVGATGVGVYQLISVPVAVVTNRSTQHSALGVVVHLTPLRNGRALQPVDSPRFTLPPGASITATGACTDSCTGATSAQATVSVTSWGDATQSPVISVSGVAFHPGGDPHIGDVDATLNAVTVPAGGEVIAFAVCSRNGSLIGGGSSVVAWQAAGSPTSTQVSVIVGGNVDACAVFGVGAG